MARSPRRSGIFLPISALPASPGIGDLGPTAYHFVDWLHRAGQRVWQILPLTIPDSTGSPYASSSGKAGNWLLISPAELFRAKLLPSLRSPGPSSGHVRYRQVSADKWRVIKQSYRYFLTQGTLAQRRRFQAFCHREQSWLEDFTLFQALKDRHRQRPWWRWQAHWRSRTSARRQIDHRLEQQRQLHAYAQWLWAEQWQHLRRYAHRRGIRLMSDLPFFVRTDSVDVWAHPELFILNAHGQPTMVAGVPPDAFSRLGQRWGNPLYRWAAHQRTNFHWWVERFRLLQRRSDIIRVDHFRGLVHTWHINAKEADARHGRWAPSPGRALLRAVKRAIPRLRLVAEDLGPEGIGADDLRREFRIPTIRLMVFGWNGLPRNPHHPSAVTADVVYYTSNHDTNTLVGWWRQEARRYERDHARAYLGPIIDIAWQSMQAASRSLASLVIFPLTDVIGGDTRMRLNRPGRQRGNWAWRSRQKDYTAARAARLARLTHMAGRS